MTERNELHTLRTLAKHLARGKRIPHHQALDMVAAQCAHPHWHALSGAWDKGWRPTAEQLQAIAELRTDGASQELVDSHDAQRGTIAGEPYELEIGFDDVVVHGKSWCVHLGHAPSEAATIERYAKPNPLDDGAFFAEIMKMANAAADGVRESISHDWPRRSTKPDADGRAMHPLMKGSPSAEWYCLHCDGKSTGAQMASNMWHCPSCSASPLDMHATAWWKEEA